MQKINRSLILGLCLILLMLGTIPAIAQENDNQTIELTPLPIGEVQIGVDTSEGADGTMLIMQVEGTRNTGCEFPIQIEQRLIEDTLYVDIYEEVAIDAICPMILLEYNELLPLNLSVDELPNQIIVNGVIASISPFIGLANSIPQPLPMATVYHEIESIEVTLERTEDDEEIITIEVTGQQGDLCEFEVMTALAYQDGWFTIEVYRELPANIRCMGGTIDYQETFTYIAEDGLGLSEGARIAFEVNQYFAMTDYVAPDDDSSMQLEIMPAIRADATVTDVTPMLTSDGLNLIALGYYASGCELPHRVTQELEAGIRVITVEIYEAVVETMVCPRMIRNFEMTVPLEDDYPDGRYTYNVNDLIDRFTLREGELMPERATNAGLTVDHIIGDVEVMIAESSPPQLILTITGSQPDGCEAVVQVDSEIDIDAGQITVHVYRNLPPGIMCPSVILDYQETVNIGQIQPGAYTLSVNEFITEIEIQ